MNTWPLRLARGFQQRQKAAAPLQIQFAHHVVNQQNRRRAVDAGEKFRLRHFQRDGQRALLPLAAELRGGFFVLQQLQIIAVRADQRGAKSPFARPRLREFHGEIIFHARQIFDAQFLRVIGDAAIRQPRERGKFGNQVRGGRG